MKVLIVWPDINSNARYEVNMGISLISAVLKKAGHNTLLFMPRVFSEQDFLSEVETYKPDIVGFSVTTHQYQYAQKYARLFKQNSNILTVFGGFHATLAPKSVIASPYVDIVCRGEGEFPMLELVNAVEKGEDYKTIDNLWVKDPQGNIIKNSLRPLIKDLDSLPFADRDFMKQQEILQNNGFRLDISCKRGCPYNCPFCCNSALRRIYEGQGEFIRSRSVDHILKELKILNEKYQIKEIHCQDDMFLLNKEWLREFSDKYSKNFQIPFHISARLEHIDEEAADLLKNAGCISITAGVESGNENLRKTILKKRMSNEEILEKRQILKKAGIGICSLNMLGIPEETPETIKETIAFNKQLDPNWAAASIFSPYPGTGLYQYCQEKGYLKDEDFMNFSSSYLDEKSAAMLTLPTISAKEVVAGHREFMNFAIKIYIKEKYTVLFPLYIIIAPLLKTPLRGILVALGKFLIFDKGRFKEIRKK